jgi:hypothetical protein
MNPSAQVSAQRTGANLGHRAVESKHLYCRGVTGCGREPAVTCNQSGCEFFGKRDVSRIVGGEIVTELPDPWQQDEVGIPRDSQVEQVLDCLIGAVC